MLEKNDNKYKVDIKERTYIFSISVIKMIDKLNGGESSRVISKQLLRSATSIGANVIEARAASSRRDFTNFLNHALKSANESNFWLGLLRDCGKVSPTEIDPLAKECLEIANILAASIIKLRAQ